MCNSVIIWLSMYFCGFKFMAGIMHKRCFFIISIPFSWHFFSRIRTGSICRLARAKTRGPRSQRFFPFCSQRRLFWRGWPCRTSCTPKRITPSTRHVWYKLKSSFVTYVHWHHSFVSMFETLHSENKTEMIFRQRFQLLFWISKVSYS